MSAPTPALTAAPSPAIPAPSSTPSPAPSSAPPYDFLTSPADDTHILQRIRRWCRNRRSASAFLTHLTSTLAAERATGRLIIHYSQGSAAIAEFHEQQRLGDPTA